MMIKSQGDVMWVVKTKVSLIGWEAIGKGARSEHTSLCWLESSPMVYTAKNQPNKTNLTTVDVFCPPS